MSIKKNFVYNVILNVVNVIFPLITAPYISRVLSPEDIGLFNFAGSFSGYFALIAALGIPTYGVREIARLKHSGNLQQTFSEIFTLSVLSTVIVSVLYIGTVISVSQLRESLLFFLLSGVVLYLKPFSIEWLFQGLEQFSFITIRSVIVKALSVLLMFSFVKTKEDLFVYLLIFIFCQCANQVWNISFLKKIGLSIKLSTRNIKIHLRPVIILFLSTVAISIYTILDSIMTGFISGYTDVAYYTHANNIVKLLISLVTSLSVVTLPRISQLSDGNDWSEISSVCGKSISVISFMVFPLCVSLYLISPVFVPLFYGCAFIGTIIPLKIFSIIIVLIGFSNLIGLQVLVPLGKDKLFLISVLSGTFSNVLLNIILIPEYGAVGASISSFISEFIVLCVMLFFMYKDTKIRIQGFSDIMKSILGSTLLIPVYLLFQSFYEDWCLLFIFFIVGSLIYITLQIILKNSSVVTLFHIVKTKFVLKK